jgi:DNA-binding transcriptional regulator YbjK
LSLMIRGGVHGVTHRAVDREAGVPVGTTSNYFRTREALLVAVARLVVELHAQDMAEIGAEHLAGDAASASQRERMTDLLARSLTRAATVHRGRYLASLELHLEAVRRPALAEALAGVAPLAVEATKRHHEEQRLQIRPETLPTLLGLYEAFLFQLVTADPAAVTDEAVHAAVAVLVDVAMGPSDRRAEG